jgi:hypothetical protein
MLLNNLLRRRIHCPQIDFVLLVLKILPVLCIGLLVLESNWQDIRRFFDLH